MQSRLIAATALVPMLAAATACGGPGLRRDGGGDQRLLREGGATAAPASVPASAVDALELDAAKVERRGTFRPAGVPHAVFVAPSAKGTICVLDVSGQHVGAGCSAGLFASHELAWTQGFDGGPAAATVRELRIAGVASARVRVVDVELSDGRRVPVQLTPGRAFMYEAVPEDVHARVLPVALLALDGARRVLDRVELPGLRSRG
jgi:hypothetical protein